MQSGARYFLLQLMQRLPGLERVPSSLYLVGVLAVLGSLALWSFKVANRDRNQQGGQFWLQWFRLPEHAAFLPGALFLASAMMLAFSPHYPWYLAWLIPFGVLLPNLPIFTYTLGLFYLSATPLGAGTTETQYRLNCLLYVLVFLACLVELMIRVGYGRVVAMRNRVA